MHKVKSQDGTQIAYERQGTGPAVILVEGALGQRAFGMTPRLAELLAPHFSAYSYDRRGRGESSDTKPFTLERELEDIAALIREAGGQASLFGISSGGCLVLEAALRLGKKVNKLALYEPPYDPDPAAKPAWRDYRQQLDEHLAAGRRGEAVALFMGFVGVPAEQIEAMRQTEAWAPLEAVAPGLCPEPAAIGEDRSPPLQRAASLAAPVLVMDGNENLAYMPFMHRTAVALAQVIPHAQQRTLEGQTHDVNVEVLAPVLVEFFSQ